MKIARTCRKDAWTAAAGTACCLVVVAIIACTYVGGLSYALAADHRAAAARSQPGADLAGLVFDVSGRWVATSAYRHRVPLHRGDGLPDGARLIRYGKEGNLVVLLNDGSIETCPGDVAIGAPILAAKQESSPVQWWSAFIALVSSKSGGWIIPVSRGSNSDSDGPRLKDSVVPYQDDQLDLTSLFSSKPTRACILRFTPLKVEGEAISADPSSLVNVGVADNAPALQTVNGLRSGLYKVELLTRANGENNLPGESWILVVADTDRYQRLSHDFEMASARSRDWNKNVPARSIQGFLRHCLICLSRTLDDRR